MWDINRFRSPEAPTIDSLTRFVHLRKTKAMSNECLWLSLVSEPFREKVASCFFEDLRSATTEMEYISKRMRWTGAKRAFYGVRGYARVLICRFLRRLARHGHYSQLSVLKRELFRRILREVIVLTDLMKNPGGKPTDRGDVPACKSKAEILGLLGKESDEDESNIYIFRLIGMKSLAVTPMVSWPAWTEGELRRLEEPDRVGSPERVKWFVGQEAFDGPKYKTDDDGQPRKKRSESHIRARQTKLPRRSRMRILDASEG